MSETPTRTWSTREAKDNLSKILTDAQHEAQIILHNGKPFAIVIAYENYVTESAGNVSAWDVFKEIRVEEALKLPKRSELMPDLEP